MFFSFLFFTCKRVKVLFSLQIPSNFKVSEFNKIPPLSSNSHQAIQQITLTCFTFALLWSWAAHGACCTWQGAVLVAWHFQVDWFLPLPSIVAGALPASAGPLGARMGARMANGVNRKSFFKKQTNKQKIPPVTKHRTKGFFHFQKKIARQQACFWKADVIWVTEQGWTLNS